MTRKLEVLANISVIVIAILIGTILVKRYLLSPSTQATAQTSSSSSRTRGSVKTGTRISLPGIDWQKSGRTLLLVLSTSCGFCTESAPFYVRLQEESRVTSASLRCYRNRCRMRRLTSTDLALELAKSRSLTFGPLACLALQQC